jgi:tetratricopeptide (TPR) repeat protein
MNPRAIGYAYGAEIDKLFYEVNFERILSTNTALASLPIDKCHNGGISIHADIDSSGIIRNVKILTGGGNKYLDSLITSTMMTRPGKWIMPVISGEQKAYVARFLFVLADLGNQYRSQRIGVNYTAGYVIYDENDFEKQCKDSEFYFESGIKNFQAGAYKSAAREFKKASMSNPYDLENLYNMGMSYLKAEDITKACECFSKGKGWGDESSAAAVSRHCSDRLKQ